MQLMQFHTNIVLQKMLSLIFITITYFVLVFSTENITEKEKKYKKITTHTDFL